MNRDRATLVSAAALVAILGVAGCGKKEEPAAKAPQPVAAAAKAPATMSVMNLDLGTAVGADMRITQPATSFGPMDTIIVAISTTTSDPTSVVSGKLGAKWSYQDGSVVNDEAREVKLAGNAATDFRIAKPDGWPKGKYKVEVTLDGKPVQSKDFEVK